jgi:hypothetical protein
MSLHTLHPDAKGRITLGALAKGVDSFVASKDKNGDIILKPMVSIPARELWLYQNKKALKMVMDGIEAAREGRVTKLGDFSKYADIELD